MTELEQALAVELREQLIEAWAEVNRLKVQLAETRAALKTAITLKPEPRTEGEKDR